MIQPVGKARWTWQNVQKYILLTSARLQLFKLFPT